MDADARPVVRHLVRNGTEGYLLWTLTLQGERNYVCRRWRLSRAEGHAFAQWTQAAEGPGRSANVAVPQLPTREPEQFSCRTLHDAFCFFAEDGRHQDAAEVFFNRPHGQFREDFG
jgi:hypothetical protein